MSVNTMGLGTYIPYSYDMLNQNNLTENSGNINSFLGNNSSLATNNLSNNVGLGSINLNQNNGLSNVQKGFGLGQSALSGLGSIASMLTGFKSLSLANKDYKLKKQSQETNLDNQVQSYNTSLSDRIKGRASQNGNISAQQQQDYVNNNSLHKAAL